MLIFILNDNLDLDLNHIQYTNKMKRICLAIFLCLSALGLNAQNTDNTRERDKKKDDQKVIENKATDKQATDKEELSKPSKSAELNNIELSDEALQTIETIAIQKGKKNKKSKDKMVSPPAQKFRVRLLIQNKNPHPMWYLMPYKGSNRLPENGLFNADPTLIEGEKMLSMRLYQGQVPETFLREILFTGLENQHFRAFYLPAGATLSLRNYNIDCWQDSETVEFWAVKELKANNNTELQNAMPYEMLSSMNVEINCPSDQNCSTEAVAPNDNIAASTEPLRFVKANKVSKYLVRLNQPQ